MSEQDIYHDIEEELHRQKLRAFWQENGSWIVGGCLGAVIFTAALVWWRGHERAQDMAATSALAAAAETGDAGRLAEFAAEAGGNHALLAQFAAAGIHAARGEAEEAAVLYGAAAQTRGADKTWRDLARLYAVMQRLDAGAPAELLEQLAPLAKKNGVWRHSAMEMQALLHARAGEAEKARDLLDALAADETAPQGIRTRAVTLRGVHAADGKKEKAE